MLFIKKTLRKLKMAGIVRCLLYFLGAKAPLQPTSSEGLYVCMCLSMSNILTPLPYPPLTMIVLVLS